MDLKETRCVWTLIEKIQENGYNGVKTLVAVLNSVSILCMKYIKRCYDNEISGNQHLSYPGLLKEFFT